MKRGPRDRALLDEMIRLQRLKDEAMRNGVDFTKISFAEWMRTHEGRAS